MTRLINRLVKLKRLTKENGFRRTLGYSLIWLGKKLDNTLADTGYISQLDLINAIDLYASKPSKNNKLNSISTINWFVPQFENAIYGGIYTILRIANHFSSQHGVKTNIVIYDNPHVNKDGLKKIVLDKFPGFNTSNLNVIVYDGANWETIPRCDIAVATFWTSAYFVKSFPFAKIRAYLIQDFEAAFYSAGSIYGMVEHTYRLGLYSIINTPGLYNYLNSNYKIQGTWFTPSVDRNLFNGHNRNTSNNVIRIFFYGRPSNERNGFELGMASFKLLKSKYGDQVEIVCAGANWNPIDYGVEKVLENYGRLDYEYTGELYRSCHIGLVFMFTKHPSYLPFELMASGVAVVTNFNESNNWFFAHKENCILCDPTPSEVVASIELLIGDKPLLSKLSIEGMKKISNMPSWEEELEKIWCSINENVNE